MLSKNVVLRYDTRLFTKWQWVRVRLDVEGFWLGPGSSAEPAGDGGPAWTREDRVAVTYRS